MCSVKELRWWLFRKKQAQSERLPPTQAALQKAILRAHYQLLVWNNDVVANPSLSSPENFGWTLEGNQWIPIMTFEFRPQPNKLFNYFSPWLHLSLIRDFFCFFLEFHLDDLLENCSCQNLFQRHLKYPHKNLLFQFHSRENQYQ